MEKTCRHCQRVFLPHPAVRDQQYCGKSECQRARKKKWQREKLANDTDYHENQAAAQKRWHSRNPDYYREYRKRSPAYTKGNRRRQIERNKQRRSRTKIANMDELKAGLILPPGPYRIVSMSGERIANMDELIVEISVISGNCATKIPMGP